MAFSVVLQNPRDAKDENRLISLALKSVITDYSMRIL